MANGFLQVSLEGCASWADIAERIQSYIRDNHVPAGEWVRAQGYDHNALAEGRHPDRQVLDVAAPEHPVILQHQSGHMGVFNTLALERLGVTEKTPCPEGGAMGREGGALTGYMEENAFLLWQRKVPMPDMAALTAACEKAQALYASCGITTVQEGMLPEQLVPIYQALCAGDKLYLDVVGYADSGRDAGSGAPAAGVPAGLFPSLPGSGVQDLPGRLATGTHRLAAKALRRGKRLPGLRHHDR